MFDKQFLISQETAIRIMVYEIRHRNPDAVKFVPTPETIKSILLHVVTKNFNTIMYCYGYKFLLEMLKMYEEAENYEICNDIKKQIEDHNSLTKDQIPTNL